MYKIIPWNNDIDLSDFYQEAEKRGFYNNASQKNLIESISKEREYQIWILYYNDIIVGSVAAHSLSEINPNAYRIAARTCVFTDKLPGTYGRGLRTISVITEHQNPTAQFFIPVCIDWVNGRGDMYITTHPSDVGTQKLVHNIYAPSLEKTNVLTRSFEREYRGHTQTFWKLNPNVFLEQLNRSPRWSS